MIPLGLFVLLLVFQVKHWLADYVLQGRYMLGKFGSGWSWVLPLAAHAGVHGLLTAGICCLAGRPELAWLGALDAGVHFGVDRLKASPRLGGRWKALSAEEMRAALIQAGASSSRSIIGRYYRARIRANRIFWVLLGLDQLVHHLTHYGIILALVLA